MRGHRVPTLPKASFFQGTGTKRKLSKQQQSFSETNASIQPMRLQSSVSAKCIMFVAVSGNLQIHVNLLRRWRRMNHDNQEMVINNHNILSYNTVSCTYVRPKLQLSERQQYNSYSLSTINKSSKNHLICIVFCSIIVSDLLSCHLMFLCS